MFKLKPHPHIFEIKKVATSLQKLPTKKLKDKIAKMKKIHGLRQEKMGFDFDFACSK